MTRSESTGRFRHIVAILLGALALGLLQPTSVLADTTPAAGTPITLSADGLPTWQINGVVWSQVVVGNTVVATGSFTKARPPGVAAGGAGEIDALNIFAYDITTGNRLPGFKHSLNAQGMAVTASPDGSRIYVGGDFTTVDGVARGHLAAFSATGALDPAFHPSVAGQVRALSASGTYLYFGGSFSSVNGTARSSLAAAKRSDGSLLLSWAPVPDIGTVWSMVVAPAGDRVIVGGRFTTLNGQAAYGMGSVDATDGAVLRQWDANKTIHVGSTSGAITSLRTDGKQIYGSAYTYAGTSNFEGTFAAAPSTGAITVLNDCHGDTYDVLPVGPVLYSVSHVHDCRPVHGFPDTNPKYLAQRALAQTIAPTTTNIGPDAYQWNYTGWPASKILQWYPNLTPGTYTGQAQAAWSIAGTSKYVVMGGEFPTVNGVAQQGLTRMAVSSLAPDKQGPTYTQKKSPSPAPVTSATSTTAGIVTVIYNSAWDYDNEMLTYDVIRDNVTTVSTKQVKSNFWTLPTQTFRDKGLTPGSTHSYQIRIKDSFGNILMSPKSTTVTVQ